MTAASILDVKNLSHVYSNDYVVSKDISFEVRPGEIVCIVGPSGCGKTTLLRAMAGLLKTTGGVIRFQGDVVSGVPEGLAMVFQEYGRSLFPWLNVADNIALPLKYTAASSEERDRRVQESLSAVGLSGFGDRYPWQLSGGMQQRVAIARALAYQPKLLLMDEPFASVDAQTRSDLEDLVAAVRERFGITIIVVTHDIDEAVYLSDRVVVLSRPPSTVMAQVEIDIPRPRDQVETKAMAAFVEKRALIAQMIRNPAQPQEALAEPQGR